MWATWPQNSFQEGEFAKMSGSEYLSKKVLIRNFKMSEPLVATDTVGEIQKKLRKILKFMLNFRNRSGGHQETGIVTFVTKSSNKCHYPYGYISLTVLVSHWIVSPPISGQKASDFPQYVGGNGSQCVS